MRLLGEETRQALRHRPAQALVLALLACAATVLTTLAPLYSADMADAVTRLDIEHADPLATALQVTSKPSTTIGGGEEVANAAEPAALAKIPPPSMRRFYTAPVLSRFAHADNAPLRIGGQMVWLPDACRHVTVVDGRCPSRAREVMVSQPDLRLHHVHLGGTFVIGGVTQRNGAPAFVRLRIVGAYRISPSRFWELDNPVGKSGTPSETGTAHDDWFTPESTFLDAAHPLPSSTSAAIFPLDPKAVRVSSFLALPEQIARLSTRVRDSTLGATTVGSTVGTLAEDVRTQRSQASRTVPLLMLQVVLLTLVVFWQVLDAAADQRRPDVALARLRGRGRRATTRALLRELLPVVEAGVLLGGVGGVLASMLARVTLIPASSFVLPWTFWAALGAAAAVVAALTYLTARNLAHQPVDRLLRQVPARHRWRWTVLDTVLLTLSAAGTIAFAAGGLGRDFALAGPALVALLAGLLLSHVVTPLAATIGRRALDRGRLVRGLAALEAARRPGALRTITMVTLAAAFLVFFANAWAVGADNRQSVAEQVVGAPRVLTVASGSLAPVRRALAAADPGGTRATPVVAVAPLGNSTAPSTLAVDPRHFSQIALLDPAARDLPWSRLTPATGTPLRITADRIALTVDTSALPRRAHAVELSLRILRSDGQSTATVPMGTVQRGRTTTLRTSLDCSGGCTLLAVTLGSTPGVDWSGRLHLDAIRAGSTVPWGPKDDWTGWTGEGEAHLTPVPTASGGLTLDIATGGESSVALTSAWLPTSLPVFTIGMRHPPTADQPALLGVDRQMHPVTVVKAAPRLPTAAASAMVVDLETLARAAAVDPADIVQIWLRDNSTGLRDAVTAALAKEGVTVVGTNSVVAQRGVYDASVATWSLSLALVIGVITLIVTLLAMIVLAVTGWRAEARDLAALQLNGVGRRTLLRAGMLARTTTVVVAVAVGAAAGVLAGWLAIDQVPLFAHRPPLTSLDLAPVPWVILLTALGTLVALLIAARVLVRGVAARARFERLREGP